MLATSSRNTWFGNPSPGSGSVFHESIQLPGFYWTMVNPVITVNDHIRQQALDATWKTRPPREREGHRSVHTSKARRKCHLPLLTLSNRVWNILLPPTLLKVRGLTSHGLVVTLTRTWTDYKFNGSCWWGIKMATSSPATWAKIQGIRANHPQS